MQGWKANLMNQKLTRILRSSAGLAVEMLLHPTNRTISFALESFLAVVSIKLPLCTSKVNTQRLFITADQTISGFMSGDTGGTATKPILANLNTHI